MIDRRRTPWGVFFVLLLLMCGAAYILCGLFKMPDVSFNNYQESLLYILLHPLQNWWTDKTMAFIGATFLGWLMMVSWYINYYRNTHFGQENGTEQWADIRAVSKRLRNPDENKNTYLSKNIAVSDNALSNKNVLILGGPGTFKSTSEVMPNLLRATCTNVFLDIKGELLRKNGNYLMAHGITVKVLNFIHPEESDRWNPFAYIEREVNLIRLITVIQTAVKPPDAMKGDPFWDDGVALYLQAMFYYEWLQSKEEHRKASFNNILKLVNMEVTKIDEEGTTALQQEMDLLAARKGDDYPPVRDYRKLKEGATETVRSIIIMVNAMLRLCEVASIRRIFEEDDIDIKSLGLGIDGNPNRKTALFLVMPDNDASFNWVASLFYTQMFDTLTYTADFECGGSLPIHVRLWADEFYAGPKPLNSEVLLGTLRGRNMSIIPVLQSIAQLKSLFPNEKWEIFMGNCAAFVYLGSGAADYTTHKFISDLLGEMTIDTRTDGLSTGMHGNANINNAKAGRALMTPGEVKRMPRDHCIIFLEGYRPIYDKKAIPFQTDRWKEVERLAGKHGYRHPIRVIYNEETLSYRTITEKSPIQFLNQDDIEFYREAAKTDDTIKVFELDEDGFLYLNWRKRPIPSAEELEDIFRQARFEKERMKHGNNGEDLPDDVKILREKEVAVKKLDGAMLQEPTQDRASWNLSGSIYDCIKRCADQLSADQLNEILEGLEAGLSEKQVKSYFCLPAEKMRQYKRAYMFGRN